MPRFHEVTDFNNPLLKKRSSMPGIRIKEGETFEAAMRRFKKQCEKSGILSELRKREHYEKPSVKKKKKAIAARKRSLKKMRKDFW